MPAIFSKEKSSGSSSKSNNLKRLLPIQCLTPSKVKHEEEDETETLLKTKYFELPKQKIFKISVLKLDGSVFDVFVKRNATVAELKVAVEEVFSSSPNEGQEKIISWSHVWGHFCLCYNGKKLINDKACVRNFGIKDGDQIRFIRHLSINYLHSKTRSKSQIFPHKTCLMLTPGGSSRCDWKEHKALLDYGITKENLDYNQFEDQGEEIRVAQFKLANLLKGWLSYTRLWGGSGSRKGSEGKYQPTRFSTQSVRA